MASTDAKPLPKKNVAYRLTCDLRLNTGALNTSAAGLDSEVSKDGGAFADCTNEWTEIGTTGIGTLDLTATEMNADTVAIKITSTTTNAVPRTITITPNEDGDITVNAAQIGGTSQTGRDIGASVLLSNGTGAGQISLSSGTVTAGTVSDKTGYSLSQTFPSNFSTLVINGSGHVTLADASLVTAKLGTFALAKTTNITGFNDLSAAQVNAEADTALADYDGPTNAEMVARTLAAASYATPTNITGGTITTVTNLTNLPSIPANWITTAGITDGAFTAAKFAAASLNGKGDWNIGKTGYSLTQTFPANFADLSISASTGLVNITQTGADKVWGSATRTLTSSGSGGATAQEVWEYATRTLTASTNLSIPSASDNATAVWAAGTRTITGGTISTVSDKTGYSLSVTPPTAATIADAVWDEAQSGHVSAGSFGLYLDAKVSEAGGGGLTAGAIADAVWDEVTSGHVTSGTFGAAMAAAGSAGDPWSTVIPAAYGAGTAGYLVGTTIPGLLVDAEITLSNPVSEDGDTVTIRRGDDYLQAIATQIAFTFSGLGFSLVGSAVTFRTNNGDEISMTVTSATAAYLERTAAQTLLMTHGNYTYEIDAVLSGGQKRTLATGSLVVTNQV